MAASRTPALEARPLAASELAAARELAAAHAGAERARFAGLDSELAHDAQSAWGLFRGGELAGLATCRLWGRQGHLRGLVIAPEHRGQGAGTALLEAVTGSLARREATLIGAEIDPREGALLSFLSRRGFRGGQATFVLEAAVVAGAGADAPLPDGVEVLADAASALPRLDAIRALSASLDADLDPSRWLARQLADRRVELVLVGGESPRACAVLESAEDRAAPGSLVASLVLVDEGPPFASLRTLVAAFASLGAARGCERVSVCAPTRWWDAFRELLDLGFRPSAPGLRLCLAGYPERSDHRRALLSSWR